MTWPQDVEVRIKFMNDGHRQTKRKIEEAGVNHPSLAPTPLSTLGSLTIHLLNNALQPITGLVVKCSAFCSSSSLTNCWMQTEASLEGTRAVQGEYGLVW